MPLLFAIAGGLAGFLILGVIVFIWALGKAQEYETKYHDNWRH